MKVANSDETRYRFLFAETNDEILVHFVEGSVHGKLMHIKLCDNKIPYVCFFKESNREVSWNRSAQGYNPERIDKMINDGIPIRELQEKIVEQDLAMDYSPDERMEQLQRVDGEVSKGMGYVEQAVAFAESVDITAGMHVGKPQEFFEGKNEYKHSAEFFMGQYVSGHRQGQYIAFNSLQNAVDRLLKKYKEHNPF
jgi:hypothetical protein